MFVGLALLWLALAIMTSVFYARGVKEMKDPNRNKADASTYYVRALTTNRNAMIVFWIFFVISILIWFYSERPAIAKQKRINQQLGRIMNQTN